MPNDRLARAQSFLDAIVQVNPGLLLENKQATVAIHYRKAPELEPIARRVMAQALEILGSSYVLLEGKMVLELKPDGFSKSTAIAAFLREPPFQGRVPIFLGDDHTDEAGFTYVEGLGGTAIHVGSNEASHARWRLRDVADVHAWLESLMDSMAHRGTR
jgi:trehalose 6-phosphate phosphatase